MDDYKLLITGETPLTGDTTVSGGKNTAVAVIPAVLLCDESPHLDRVPDLDRRDSGLSDVHCHRERHAFGSLDTHGFTAGGVFSVRRMHPMQ